VTCGRLTRRDSHSAIVTSQALDWPGVRVEAGRNDVSAVDDLVGDQHYLSLNLDPGAAQARGPESPTDSSSSRFRRRVSGSAPARMPITLRLNSTLRYLRVALDPLHLARLVTPSLDSVEPIALAAHLRRAVAADPASHADAQRRGGQSQRGGAGAVEAVTAGLGHLLLRHAGVAQPRALRAALDWRRPPSGACSRYRCRSGDTPDDRDARAAKSAFRRRISRAPSGSRSARAPSVPAGAPPGARAQATRDDRCEPFGYRAAHRVRRPGAFHETLQARLR